MSKGIATMEDSLVVPPTVREGITIGPSNSIFRYIFQRLAHRHLNTCVHSIIIHKSQKLETIWVFINKLMDKQNLHILTNTIQLKKKKWSFNTCDNMVESWTHYAKWNKPDRKRQIVGFHLSEVSGAVRFTEIEKVVIRGWEEGILESNY